MKSTELAKAVKELTGASTNEAALEALQTAFEKREGQQPFGVLLVSDPEGSGVYWSHVFGVRSPVSPLQAQQIQGMCRHYAEAQLEPVIKQLERAEIEARVRAELKGEVDDV